MKQSMNLSQAEERVLEKLCLRAIDRAKELAPSHKYIVSLAFPWPDATKYERPVELHVPAMKDDAA